MQVVSSGLGIPPIKSSLDLTDQAAEPLRAVGPADARNRPLADKGDVFEVIFLRSVGSSCLYEPEADDLTVLRN